MKFKIKRLVLLNALSKTTKAVSAKSPLPSLTGIKFELTHDMLRLTGSDSDITIQTCIYVNDNDLDIIETGSVILSARYILDIVRKLDCEYITIEFVDGLLTAIKGSFSKFELNGTDALEYPRINLNKTGSLFKLDATILKDIVRQTKFATSDKETKPLLTGINFKCSNHLLECVATDSYRLAKKVVSIDSDISFNITIPQKSLDDISKIIDKEKEIDIYVNDRKILFILDNTIIQTRLIDGTYLDTSKLIPVSGPCKLEIDINYLMKSVERVSLLTNEMNSLIKLDMSEDSVILSSKIQEIGSVDDKLNDSFYSGNPISISFSSKYLSEAIRSFTVEKVRLSFDGDMKPFIITCLDTNDVIQLILPVRT
ncbi:DNA polymerase III subunit beta [Tannockella kyphosi]|uniref:DNA polymerase III subunit beta n=1 Tax=Tannockella kyphosi TaxID=2899121 RepID=UPI002010EA36|nr:DNA polymerase III subunit beta [Tannockella kyphosi]